MKYLLPIFLFFTFSTYAQSADFLQVKKRGKTIKTIFAGNDISITTESGAFIYAYLKGIKSDSIFLQEFVIRFTPTTIGTYIKDTVGSFKYQYHYKDIKGLGKIKQSGFDTKGSGASLFGGGVVLSIASGIVYLVDRNKFSPALLYAGLGLGTAGYFLAKTSGKGTTFGKKYKLLYMDMSPTK